MCSANEQTKLIIFNRNYGQTTALAAGIDLAKGKYIVTMDGDLQNDPRDMLSLVQKIGGRVSDRPSRFLGKEQ